MFLCIRWANSGNGNGCCFAQKVIDSGLVDNTLLSGPEAEAFARCEYEKFERWKLRHTRES